MSDSKYKKARRESVSRMRGALLLGGVTAVVMLGFTLSQSARGFDLRVDHDRFEPKTIEASEDDDYVYYFAYASDLLQERIQISCPSAEKITTASLPRYKFGFTIYSKVWKGGVADIYPTNDETDEVWGVVYKVSRADLGKLDKQKGVGKADPKYRRISVRAIGDSGRFAYISLSYNIVDSKRVPVKAGKGYEKFAPSIQYKKCVLNGAKENAFAPSYIERLERIRDNGNPYRRKAVGSACDKR